MKKILVVGLSDNIGGIETFFHTYYMHIDRHKYHFDFASVTSTIAFGDKYEKDGATIYKLPHFLKSPLNYYRTLRNILKENHYDIIHINMLSAANILPVKAARAEKIPCIIIHSHNSDVPHGVIRNLLNTLNMQETRKGDLRKIACGKKAGRWLFGKNAHFQVIPNAIDARKFTFNKITRQNIRKKLGVSDNEILLGNIGRLCEQKNQPFLIDLLAELEPKYKLIIIGSGDYQQKIIKKANKLDIKNRLILISNTPDVAEYYNAMDIFVFPSLFEGMPIAPIEAQANGLPCICSNNITKEIDMGNITFVEPSVQKWKKVLSNVEKSSDRKQYLSPIYDINMQSHILEQLYDSGEVSV